MGRQAGQVDVGRVDPEPELSTQGDVPQGDLVEAQVDVDHQGERQIEIEVRTEGAQRPQDEPSVERGIETGNSQREPQAEVADQVELADGEGPESEEAEAEGRQVDVEGRQLGTRQSGQGVEVDSRD